MNHIETFFEELKIFLLKEEVEDSYGYFAVLRQNESLISALLNDFQYHSFSMDYIHDDTGGYTCGQILFYLSPRHNEEDQVTYHYIMELLSEDDYCGYCQCEPGDTGYNEIHECCGVHCDWSKPRIRLKKVDDLAEMTFSGRAKDLWAYRSKWKKEQGLYAENERLEKIQSIEKQIQRLESAKNSLLSQDN